MMMMRMNLFLSGTVEVLRNLSSVQPQHVEAQRVALQAVDQMVLRRALQSRLHQEAPQAGHRAVDREVLQRVQLANLRAVHHVANAQ
jgi:hypothetical protein